MTTLRRVGRLLQLAWAYVVDLLLANQEVARIILLPTPPQPSVIAITLDTREPWVVAALANMITVTPGTLTLEVAPDGSRLYVHVLTTRPLDEHRAQLATLQRRLLEALT